MYVFVQVNVLLIVYEIFSKQNFVDCFRPAFVQPQLNFKTMYHTVCTPPKFYALPKTHKTGTSSGPLPLAGVQSHMG